MQKLIECVPNFSEGRDLEKIKQITDSIEKVEGVTLLDVDPGQDTNRTVVTIIGTPKAVAEAAFRGIKTASHVIDMQQQKGTHPRMGATDVCPFVPVSGVTMDECVKLSKQVGKRVGEELGIPVYLYEYSAQKPDRANLAKIRSGEYEGLADKLKDPHWKPDFGPTKINLQAGATVMGGRDFLIAYNINLNTRDKRIANDIAFELREKGRSVRIPNSLSTNLLDGNILRYKDGSYPCSYCEDNFTAFEKLKDHFTNKHSSDIHELFKIFGYSKENLIGKAVKKPGSFKDVKAIGWYVEEFKRAQISINFTKYKNSTIHDVFDKANELAIERGVRVTGSELVGLIPLDAIIMAGKHYLRKQGRTTGVTEEMLIESAVQSLGLNDVTPFNAEEKIIDFAVKDKENKLIDLSVKGFSDELSTNSPAPGGGSVAALAGVLSAALTSMVAALSHEKKGFLDKREMLESVGEKAQNIKERLSFLIDEDTNAFNNVMAANRISATTPEEIKEKEKLVLNANKYAAEIPLEVAETSFQIFELAELLVEKGNPNSVSDVGVAGEAAYTAVRGACLNILINLGSIESDKKFVNNLNDQVDKLLTEAEKYHKRIFAKTRQIINS
ncbi:MAG: glutamate formimidoyltransferase [Candidatus Neomarinimicrobiota bacterium]